MSNNSNNIIKRIYIAVDVTLASPLSICNGLSKNTDNDILKNSLGEIFIPGTSLAGAMRNYLENDNNSKSIFGYANGNEGEMSSLFIADTYIDKTNISVRDGVGLNKDKIAIDNQKYDYEIVETGKGTIRIEVIIRKYDENKDKLKDICKILKGISNGDIRFGYKKNRGLGKLKVTKVYKWEFDKASVKDWLKFNEKTLEEQKHLDNCVWENWQNYNNLEVDKKYISISLPLKLTGGISIRKYSTMVYNVNFEHITIQQLYENGAKKHNLPIIPGTSWAGAIRHRAEKILNQLKCSEAKSEQLIKKWFGYVDTDNDDTKNKSCQSMIVIDESILKNSNPLITVRNNVNRFSGATVEGALYKEKAYFGGDTVLKIKVQKDKDGLYKSLIALLYLVMKDIEKGYLSIGGATAIGRGLFTENGDITITFPEKDNLNECNKELIKIIQSEEM